MASTAPHTRSELAYQLIQAGLDAEYWTDILKTKVSITRPHQIQYLGASHHKVLKDSIRQEGEEKALRKFLGINSEPSSNQASKDARSHIVVKLTEAGLDGEYWSEVFKKEFDITRVEQTAKIQTENMQILKDAVRHDCEEEALTNFFGISEDDNEAFLAKLKQKGRQRLLEAINLLADIAVLKKKGLHHTDDMIDSKLDQLRQLMKIAKEQWIIKDGHKSFDDVISKMKADLRHFEKLPGGRPVNSASEILERASTGLALRGVLVGKAFSDDCVKRIVLSTPIDGKLMSPVMPQIDEAVHFFSKEKADRFHRSLDTMGFSVATTVKSGDWGFQAEFSESYGNQCDNLSESEADEQKHFESRVLYSVVPTVACELNPYSLKLSQEALRELKTIDKLLAESENRENVDKMCEEFLKSYGSHINAGVLHFGGVNKFIATYTSENSSKSGIAKCLLEDALNDYASVSCSVFGFSEVCSVSADHLKTNDTLTTGYDKSELAKTCLHTTRNGGPQEVSTFSLWKMGLITCDSTWALIDRGKTLSRDFAGIWELIPNHKGEFLEPYELASSLMTAWENLSGYVRSSEKRKLLIEGLDAMNLLVERIATWNSHPILPEMCIGHLQEVLKTVEQVTAQTGTNKYWEDKLYSEVDIQSFLEKIVELKSKFASKDVSIIKYLIRKLLTPTGFKEFPGKQNMMNWATANLKSVDIPSVLANAGIKSIPDLIRNVKEKCVPALQIEHAKNIEGNVQVSDSINAGATIELAFCVDQLSKDLQSSEESHQSLFLKGTLLPLQYNWPKMKFDTLITIEKLQEFVQSIETLWKKFQVKKEKGIIPLEAFLIHIVLTYGHFDGENEASEHDFSELTKDLRQVISPELNKVLNRYATISPFNWVEITRVTGELAKGNMSVAEDKQVDIDDLKQVFGFHGRKGQEQEPMGETHMHGFTAQEPFFDIMKTLGLDEYYPSKIALLDAMIIKKDTEQPRLVDIPWMILRKLLMIDFNARDQCLSVFKQSQGGEIANGIDEFGLDDFLQPQSCSSFEDRATHLNPLDVLVAIFTCCDNFLKQILAQKLFVCKLAIPFMYALGSEDNLVMSLWALRTITVLFYTKQKEPTETPVTDNPLPLVTFVRLGRPPLSKSKLMNDILRDDSHDTFFNHDCNNGTVARRLTDGLVECSWFIPTGKENDHLPDTTMFLNLRGDASSMEKQMQILQEISSVMFVIVTVQDLAKSPNTSTCQQILQAGAKVILFLISGIEKQNIQDLIIERKACAEAVGPSLLKGARIILSSNRQGIQKNVSDIKTEARNNLTDAIVECPTGLMMEDCARRAEKNGVTVDEFDDEACLEGKVLAEKIVNHMNGKNIIDCKRVLLPLQGTEWMEYCKLLKKQHRASGKGAQLSSAYHANQLKQKMDLLREQQVEICSKKLPPFMKDFMSDLETNRNNQNVVLYYLKWITLFLDKISRANLPGLRKQYHILWNEFQQAKNKQESAKMNQLKPQVDYAEIQLASASLGLENLFRELGQIYEAVNGSEKTGNDTRAVVEYLPEIAAKLLLKGIPLELVDGDASSVPISWVSAVLSMLGNIIGEKRLFVLSALGIQSSGKSTLLNTMFGLQFAVSAGRCTRGAYMQLIPVDDHAQLPFNYIIVIDTEGLRAPELGQLKHEHDNELATLVIGLSDVTLLNIKEANTSEMKDILQIAVHAFLRMNLVSKNINIKDHRTCIFVHQNVAASNAEELMMHGCQKLQESLDDMAKEAARSENKSDIHSFSQIINFDVQKHVWYFSDLWHGDPPMAPANPGYSKKVDAVRLSLLVDIAKGQTTFLTPSDLSIRLSDLWNGVLVDDFVFSFRNSLEVKAYNNLQSKYYSLEWELLKAVRNWLQKAEIKLRMCESLNDLESSFQLSIADLCNVLTEKSEETKACLRNYFEKSNLVDIIIQWQQSKLNQLNLAVEQQLHEGTTDLLSVKQSRRIEILQTEKWSEHEAHIMKKAVELADKLKGKEENDAELEKKFDVMWVRMVQELAAKSADKEDKMDILMEQILCERFYAHGAFLRKELRRRPLDIPLAKPFLEGRITLDEEIKCYISLKTTIRGNLKKLNPFGNSTNNPELQAMEKTHSITSIIFQEINTYLKDMSSQDTNFQKSYALEVIQMLQKKTDNYNNNAQSSEDYTFTFLPKYIVKLAVHVSRHCVQIFTLMQSKYNKKHGIHAKLKDYKKTAWSLFKNMVKQSTEEVIAGDLLCTEVKKIIEKAVKREIPRTCIDEVLRDFQMTKYYLIVKMMDDLACKGNFNNYKFYIKNAKEFALKWITQYTNEKFLSRHDGSGMTRYAEITQSHIGRIIRCIVKSVEHATTDTVKRQPTTGMARWIKEFCQRVSEEIAIPASTLKHMAARKVVDFNNLQRIILDQLEKSVELGLKKMFDNETKDSVNWNDPTPSQLILDKIWGCPEQCPFCWELCADTTAGHYDKSGKGHMCVQHRPVGIRGVRWLRDSMVDGISVSKDQLLHYSCNYSVQLKNVSFKCAASTFKCRDYGKCTTTERNSVDHKYLEYNMYLPSWDIAPDLTNNVSKYWMWFMATYQSQLKDMYESKLPNIPESWSSITKEDALADLRKIHN